MRYLHTMVRIRDIEESLDFYVRQLGFVETRRKESEKGRFTLIFLCAPHDKDSAENTRAPELELTYNWDTENYSSGSNFGHVGYEVEDIYALCQSLQDKGVTLNRPPRDGRMAFIRSPDGVSIEFLQKGAPLAPQEPWVSMENTGSW